MYVFFLNIRMVYSTLVSVANGFIGCMQTLWPKLFSEFIIASLNYIFVRQLCTEENISVNI